MIFEYYDESEGLNKRIKIEGDTRAEVFSKYQDWKDYVSQNHKLTPVNMIDFKEDENSYDIILN